jgi:peptidoglycan/LPS O-acetylase OafA/YrhL
MMANNLPPDVALHPEPSGLTRHRPPLNALTGIRFFAAWYVVFFHTRLSANLLEHHHALAGNFLANGFLAVPLFFLLSGFILAYTYHGQIHGPGRARRFWEARFARIWPLYMLSLLFSSIPSFTLPPIGQTLAAIFMVQAWNPLNPHLAVIWNGVCWTLSVEALFYLVFPPVQIALEKLSNRSQLLFIALMLLLCLLIGNTKDQARTDWIGYIPIPVLHLPEFFTGVTMGNYFLRRLASQREQSPRGLLAQAGAFAFGSGLWTNLALLVSLALLFRPQSFWTPLEIWAFAALLFGLAAENTWFSRFLSTPLLVLGGGISYSVYLMQDPVRTWVTLFANRIHLHSETVRMGLVAVTLLVLSLILFKFVEESSRRFLRSTFARWEKLRERAALKPS